MAQVPETRRPFSYAGEAPYIAAALDRKYGNHSRGALAKLLAFAGHETGGEIRNNNPTNMRRNGADVSYYVHGGDVTEYRNGQVVRNVNKEFRSYPDPVSGYVAVLEQIERRWPKALQDLFSDARTVEDLAATFSPLPSGYWWFGKPWEKEADSWETIKGVRTWVPFAQKRADNLRARAAYASALRRHLPAAEKGAGVSGSPFPPAA